MTDIFGVIILFSAIVLVSFILFFTTKKMKKDAEAQYGNLRQALGVEGWKVTNAPSMARCLYFNGTFMGRKVRCEYRKTILGNFIFISSKPRGIPKKIPWYTFKSNHPIIYKNYTLIYSTVTARMSAMIDLSTERCNEILTDLNHACEMVERGDYQLS